MSKNKKKDIDNKEEVIEDENSKIEYDIDKLLQDIEELQKINKELDNKYLMAYADAQNISKRAHKDAENLIINRTATLFEGIIPIVDNFQRALSIDVNDENLVQYLKGFELIYQQLNQIIKDVGVETIESLGKEFDPNFHQSIGSVKDESVVSNIVVEELQKGYKYKSKIIRPAMVKISE